MVTVGSSVSCGVREALALKQRMQRCNEVSLMNDTDSLRGTCDETEDATNCYGVNYLSWIKSQRDLR